MPPLAATPTATEPTHACVRCGRPVAIDVALCEECNPLGLKQPAATQVHAIAAGGILFFVVVLAVLARVGLAGVGPFSGEVRGVEVAGEGLTVTLAVSNAGTKDGATTCRVIESGDQIGGVGQVVQTPSVPAGQTISFTASVTAFGTQPRAGLLVECASP